MIEIILILSLTLLVLSLFVFGYFINKINKKNDEDQEIKNLFIELKDSIIKEDYERAAIIRDKLRKLTK